MILDKGEFLNKKQKNPLYKQWSKGRGKNVLQRLNVFFFKMKLSLTGLAFGPRRKSST